MKALEKGSYDYLKKRKKIEVLKTISLFAVSAALFIAGYLTTKSKGNLLTVVAVLGCLPASKCAVNMIMNLKIKKCPIAIHTKIEQAVGTLNGYYNLYFTSYDRNFLITHLVITSNQIVAYSNVSSIKASDFEKHIEQVLSKDGIKDISVKLFMDLDKYITRLEQLNENFSETPAKEAVKRVLFSVSI